MAVAIGAAEQDVYPPRVLITVTGLTLGDDAVIYRSALGAETPVRAGSVVDATDTSLVVIDAELPFGVPVTYVVVVNGADTYRTTETVDTFARSESNGFGGVWTTNGGVASDYAVNGTAGTISAGTALVQRSVFTQAAIADVDMTVTVSTGELAVGNRQELALMARRTDDNNMYLARLKFQTDQTVTLDLQKRVASVQSAMIADLLTGLTHAPGTAFKLRMRVSGSTIQARAWLAAGSEPGTWGVSVTDTDLTAGGFGMRTLLGSGHSNLPVVFTLDDFSASWTPGTYTLPGGKVVLSDAINGLAAEVTILAWPSKTYGRRMSRFEVGGRNVVVTGELGQFSGPIELFTETTSARDNVFALARDAVDGIVQVRQPGGYDGIDSYVVIGPPEERRWSQDGEDERRIIAFEAIETESWNPLREARGYTYADLANAYTGLDYDDLGDDYATYLALRQGEFG